MIAIRRHLEPGGWRELKPNLARGRNAQRRRNIWRMDMREQKS